MSRSRENPLSTQVLGRLSSDPLTKQIAKLHRGVKSAADARSSWVGKQERLLRQRRGIRERKTFPWPGANNWSWPLTDAIIRRWKPGIAGLVQNAEPVTNFFATKPDGIEAALDAQQFYHHQFHQIPDVPHKLLRLTDWIAQHGRAWTRQGWEYKTRKSCRIVRAESLFPGGPEATYEQVVAQLDAQRQQVEQAVQAGQAPPEALDEIPPMPDIGTFVRETLKNEYQIGLEDEPLESQQVEIATQQILAGAKHVKFYYHVVEADRLAWEVWSPMRVIVPPRLRCVEDAEFVCFVHRLTTDDILRMAADGHIDVEPAEYVADKFKTASSRFQDDGIMEHDGRGMDSYIDVQDRSEGIDPREGDGPASTIEVWEIFCKLDIDDDGIREKVVLWLVPGCFEGRETAEHMRGILAVYPYPMPFDEWNVTAFDFEQISDRPYGSRGIAEMCSVFQANVNKLHNARLDALQIVLSPMFTLRASGPTESLRRNVRLMPGVIIPLPPDGEFQPVDTQAVDVFQSLSEENFTKSLAEQYIGVFDPGVLQQNAAERRTATEVEAVLSQVNSIASSDASLFQANMAKVHRQLWKLLMEFGSEEVYFRVMGEEQPKMMSKSDIDHEYEIVPAGTPINSQRQLIAARAREAVQLLFADQSGLINRRELYRWYLSTIDNTIAKRVLRTEQEAAAVQAIVQAANMQAEQNGEQPGFESF